MGNPYIPCEPENRPLKKLGTSSLQSTQNIKNTRASSRFFIFLVFLGKLRFPSFFGSNIFVAGDEGFEPPNGGTRTHCLTTWRIPNGSNHYITLFVFYIVYLDYGWDFWLNLI